MSKSRYFLPPLLASFSFGLFSIPMNLIENWSKYSQFSEIINQIGGAIVFTPFIYMTVFPIHLLGCVFVKILKYINCYSLLVLLISGFSFGYISAFFFDYKGSDYDFYIIAGLSGMIATWNYYSIDKKDRGKKDKAIDIGSID